MSFLQFLFLTFLAHFLTAVFYPLAIHVQHVYTFGLQGKFLYVSIDHNKVTIHVLYKSCICVPVFHDQVRQLIFDWHIH